MATNDELMAAVEKLSTRLDPHVKFLLGNGLRSAETRVGILEWGMRIVGAACVAELGVIIKLMWGS